jgi:hypothetical protein
MKQLSLWTCAWLLLFPISRLPAVTNAGANDSSVYRVVIPHYFFEYKIPKSLQLGYGGVSHDIAFSNPEMDRSLPFGDRATTKEIATYFFGVVGDFRDYDMTLDFFVLKANDGDKFASLDEFSTYVAGVLSKPFILKNGGQVTNFGTMSRLKVPSHEVVVATAADMFLITEQRLSGRTTTTFAPYKVYFIRLDEEVIVGIRVEHHTQKRLSTRWHAQADAMLTSIIKNLKFTPRGVQ